MKLLYFVVTGVVSAAIGFGIGYFVRGRKAKKELDKTSEFYSAQLKALDKKVRESKTPSTSTEESKDSTWEKIEKDIEEKRFETTPEQRAVISERLESQLAHRTQHRENYHAILTGSGYSSEEEALRDNGNGGIIRDYADNGVYEIPIREAEEDREFPEIELEYYESTGDLVKDGEVMDEMDIPEYIGYSKEALAARLLYDDSYLIYIRNPNHNAIYSIHVTEGVMK